MMQIATQASTLQCTKKSTTALMCFLSMAAQHRPSRIPTNKLYHDAMKQDDYQRAGNSALTYQRMTEVEKKRHDELIKRLDEMILEKRDRDRRQNNVPIDFEDRRKEDRRK